MFMLKNKYLAVLVDSSRKASYQREIYEVNFWSYEMGYIPKKTRQRKL